MLVCSCGFLYPLTAPKPLDELRTVFTGRVLSQLLAGRCSIEFVDEERAVNCLDLIKLVHSSDHVVRLFSLDERGGCLDNECDTFVRPGFLRGLLECISCSVVLAAHLVRGRARLAVNLYGGFTCPSRDSACGFGPVNDVAIVVEYARRFLGVGRVAVVNIDLHHPVGLQRIYWEDDSTLIVSLHGFGPGLHPGTGRFTEVGGGAGKWFKLNVPLPPGAGDEAFVKVFERLVPEALRVFKPDLTILVGGVDGYYRDPLSILRLTCYGFRVVGSILARVAKELGVGVLVLGGDGFGIESAQAFLSLLEGLAGLEGCKLSSGCREGPSRDHPVLVERLLEVVDVLLSGLEARLGGEDVEEEWFVEP